jgi:hypothetical protein
MRKMLERTSGRARAKARSSQRWQKEKRVEKRQWERYRENGKAVTVVMESRTVGGEMCLQRFFRKMFWGKCEEIYTILYLYDTYKI